MHKTMGRMVALLACLSLLNAAFAAGESKPVNVAAYKETIRVACIGDSITAGGGGYVPMLQETLGSKWQVTNFGVSGATLLRNGDKPFNRLGEYARALELKPDVATIALGTNDSKPGNWSKKAEFEADYKAMIADLRKANPKVIIYCCLPPPAFGNKWGIDGNVIKGEMSQSILKIAKETKCNVVDLHAALDGKGDHLRDGVHPNGDGLKLMAAAIYKALTGKAMPAGN